MSTTNNDRREFSKNAGIAGEISNSVSTKAKLHLTAKDFKNVIPKEGEVIPGMAEQGKGIRHYVESEYAKARAVLVGNASELWIPDVDMWEYNNLLKGAPEELKDFMVKYGGTNLWESNPEIAQQMKSESDALAAAFRKHGVHVIRNETGSTPKELVDYNYAWSGQRQWTLFGQSASESFGHAFVSFWEVSNSCISELAHREAINEIMKNDKEAIWMSMPAHFPAADRKNLGPFLAPGDPIVLNKKVIIGIGVEDPSHINDPSKPRSSGDEYGAEILTRMLKPLGWETEIVYFNSNYTYHIDCMMAPLEEGLVAVYEEALITPLEEIEALKGWEVIKVSYEDFKQGACNNEPLGDQKLILPAGCDNLVSELEGRGWLCEQVPYNTIYSLTGSGIHCSTAGIWRQS
ncbi:hypothetical protein LNL84_11585 [Vibrio sp. ZSDZ34]|uniref:Amidinotransferase n=1 Tax=Vibrio gelatinilyticus TaxID=2893468 RepID=A0A9X2AZE1_9VIBR|nr:hypothetical protein [Vibrio gelatinilyticus]MCJ2377473.1 hypothetical protein [Vibrio gelatinilyticus]